MVEPALSKGLGSLVQAVLLLAFPWASCAPLHRAHEITCL